MYKRNYGLEKALKHIEEAEELSRELGGVDKDVKKYFFSLPPDSLSTILTEYGRKYGEDAEQYAREAFFKWKAESRRMSGMVACRLFNMLPTYMPLTDKYKLIKNLWEQYCPRSQITFTIINDTDIKDLISKIRKHLSSTVVSYEIPASLQKRFTWLSAGDANVKQQLLNYFLQQERDITMNMLEISVPTIMNTFNEYKSVVNMSIDREIYIGHHTIKLSFTNVNKQAAKIKISPASVKPTNYNTKIPWWIWMCFISIMTFLCMLCYWSRIF